MLAFASNVTGGALSTRPAALQPPPDAAVPQLAPVRAPTQQAPSQPNHEATSPARSAQRSV